MDSVRILPVTIALVVFTGVLAPEMRAACPDFGAATGSPFAAGTSPRSLAIADINRDGKLDLVIANFTSNNVSILLGNGAGGFSPAAGSPFTAGTGPTSVTIADFNGNGKLDVAVANSSSNDVTLLLGDGTGGFSPAASPFAAGFGPQSIAAADFNGDGKPDLAIANLISNNVTILIGNGTGGFTPAAGSPFGVGVSPRSLAIADFNRDGIADLAVANSDSAGVTVLIGDGSGAFTAAAGSPFAAGTTPWSVAAGDVNSDGKPDLVVANPVTNNVSVLLGDGSGGFAAPANFAAGTSPRSVVIGDLNGDSKLDLAVADATDGKVTVLLGNGSGSFTAASNSPYTVGASPRFVSSADFNHDGKPDLAVVNTGDNTVSILLSNGSCLTPCNTFSNAVSYPTGDFTNIIASADFNRDGKIDFAVGYNGFLAILLGNGDGTFLNAGSIGIAAAPGSIVVGDFNRDGKQDLAVSTTGGHSVKVLLGDGAGGFAAPVTNPLAGGLDAESLAAADLNGDGIPDLIVVDGISGDFFTLLGNGNGTFAAATSQHPGQHMMGLAVFDYDGDGKLDIAVGFNGVGVDQVAIQHGNGDGTFVLNARIIAVGNNPFFIATADFNHDGFPDLAVANKFSGSVTILLGTGTNNFTSPGSFSVTGQPSALGVGDIDGDGNLDLAATNVSGSVPFNAISTLLGNVDGTFRNGGNHTVGVQPNAVVIADLNGDGKADIATANINNGGGPGDVTVLLAYCPDLAISKSHTGNFTQGQTATFNITVSNAGSDAVSGTLTVTDTLPSGLSNPAMSGTGWTCPPQTPDTCTRSDTLDAGASYPGITITADVAITAPASVMNTATVSGTDTNDNNNTATDTATVFQFADMTVTKSHTDSFTQGDVGRTYTLRVRNAGFGPSSGTVTLTETLPAGLTATNIDGGVTWNCTLGNPTSTCTRNDVLAGGANFPLVTMTVNVANNAPFTVTNAASVTGGGEIITNNNSVSDTTTIHARTNCGTFASPAIRLSGFSAPTSVAAGDFNGDGTSDMVVANAGANTVSVFISNGNGTFAAAVTYPVGSNPSYVIAGDLNGDGKTDLAVANHDSNDLSILLGNGDGTFAAAVNYGGVYGSTSIAIGDFDGDGRADLAVAGIYNTVTILLGNGDGTFPTHQDYTVTGGPRSVAVGDFNGDGNTDLVVASLLELHVSVLLGNGDGTFAAPVEYAMLDGSWSVAVADFDGDGKADFAVTFGGGNAYVAIFLGNGDGSFAGGGSYATGWQPQSVVAGDFNGDGKTDLAIANNSTNDLWILSGNGNGTFAAPAIYATESGPTQVAIGDFNGDGRADLAVTNHDSNSVSLLLAFCADLTIAKSHTGNFTQGQSGATFKITVGSTGTESTKGTITVIDTLPAGLTNPVMSGSGWTCPPQTNTCTRGDALAPGGFYPDITIAVNVAPNAPSSVMNTATVSGADANTGNNTATDSATVSQYADLTIAKSHVGTFTQGDVGRSYTLVARNVGFAASSGTVTVADTLPAGLTATNVGGMGWNCTLGNPTSTCTRNDALASQTTFPAITLTVNVANNAAFNVPNTATVSGGGEIITSNDSISDATTIHAMANCGAFGSATNFSAGASPAFVLVGDFNADGKRDMAVANSGSNNVSILLGNGSGGFAAAVNYAAGAQPSGLAKADFNGDGKIDLAVTNAGASSVSILLGNGNGTFGTPTDYGTGTGPAAVVMADFDGDGKADLAVANRGSDNISILLGNGNGTFSAAQNYGSGGLGAQSIALATGDFNSDGKIDLAVANWGANNVSIFLGAGDGTFASAVNYSTGPYPSSIAIDDFNGDGKADLVLGSETPGIQGTMTVLLGIGDGTFVLHAQYPAGMQSRSVVSGDFNGDKKADLAFANNGAGDVSIFFGNGDATFAGPTNYNVQSSPTHIAVSDFNGDGKADLAVVNNGSGSVSLLLASCPVDLSITKSHTGNFTQGQTGATYTITATNSAASNPTSGTVTVTDSLPAGLTATGIAGTGWSCALAALTCTRSDALTGGAIYPPITVTVSVNSNAAATVINTATISGGGDQSAGNNTASNPTTINPSAGLIAPTNLVAIATSTTNISLTWNAVTNAASYQVFRSSNNGGYAQVGTPSGAAFNDTVTNINPTTYLYRVQAVDASNNVGPQSNIDLATTIVFTDDPLTSGLTFIKATHIAQLRIAVDAVRSAAGLAAATYTYPATAGTVPHAFDITELRTALDAARNAIFGASGLVYTDSTITPGVTTMKTAHIQELRSGVK